MNKPKFNYDKIKEDYLINDEDDDRIYDIKMALTMLTPVERKIFLTYTELGSYSATAREFSVSSPTIKSYILDIKNKIFQIIQK